jgi:hypothetical protein
VVNYSLRASSLPRHGSPKGLHIAPLGGSNDSDAELEISTEPL